MRFQPFLFSILVLMSVTSHAQSDVDEIEKIFKDEDRSIDEPAPLTERTSPRPESLSDIRKLEPFQDIAVIQRRYLPKTGRFETSGNFGMIVNDAFFQSYALNGRFGYHFAEAWGVELVGLAVGTSEKDITSDLKIKRGVTTESLVNPRYYYGAAVKWSPIYGKMTWRNRTIVPFDHYFSLGGGMTTTNQDSTASTIHVGTGQIYAITKSVAFRVDVSWFTYSSTSKVTGATQSGIFNNLYMTMGVSFFFPEASYR